MAAQDEREGLAAMKADDVARLLGEEGYALFGRRRTVSLDGTELGESLESLVAAPPASASDPSPEPALPVARAAAPLARVVEIEGLEVLDASDMVIPNLKVAQAMTKERDGVADGEFFLTDDPAGTKSVERVLVILDVGKGRELLGPYENPEQMDALVARIRAETSGRVQVPEDHEGAICYSLDRVAPVPQDHGVVAASCKGCKFAEWRTVRNRAIRDCNESYRFLAVDETEADAARPVVMRLRGSAIKPTKALLTQLQLACAREQVGVFGFRVRVTTKKTVNDRGTFYTPAFGRPERLSAEETARFSNLRQAVRQARETGHDAGEE